MEAKVMNDSELSKLFKIRKTVLEMLEDRWYLVSITEKGKPCEEWSSTFKSKKDSLMFYCQKINDENDFIYVEFLNLEWQILKLSAKSYLMERCEAE